MKKAISGLLIIGVLLVTMLIGYNVYAEQKTKTYYVSETNEISNALPETKVKAIIKSSMDITSENVSYNATSDRITISNLNATSAKFYCQSINVTGEKDCVIDKLYFCTTVKIFRAESGIGIKYKTFPKKKMKPLEAGYENSDNHIWKILRNIECENEHNKSCMYTKGIGNTVQYYLTIGNEVIEDGVEWTSSNASVLSIDQTGMATAHTAGNATIKAYYNGAYASLNITVKTPTIEFEKNTVSMYLVSSSSATLEVKVNGQKVENNTVSWKSSDTSIATVSTAGVVTPKAAGKATITATLNGVSATANITVHTPSISVSTTSVTIKKGKSVTASVSVRPIASKITYKSSNTAIATVTKNDDGTYTIKGVDKGTAKISFTSNGKTATVTVTVE